MTRKKKGSTTDTDYDVIIIGAGINGAALFRDLCLQGLRCLIVDKGDFGSGTSAAPSRLIHGGLKYLETGEFRLVAESARERNLLLKNAPHVVKPLSTVIPVRSWFDGIWASINTFFGRKVPFRSRGMLLIATGLWLYDRFGRAHRTMPNRKLFSKKQALRMLPSLTTNIVGLGNYHDAKVKEPERLILELLEDGVAASPSSKALNYCPLVATKNGKLEFQPEERAPFEASTATVINAGGPWIDRINGVLGAETTLIGGTKGSHILVDDPGLVAELDGKMVYFEGDDGRILLVFDYHGKLLVGSTDIPADDPDELVCTEEEITYFLEGLTTLFPKRKVRRDQIVYSYAGLRPLPNSEGVEPGLISRDHSAPIIEADKTRPYAIISLVGGKWTTFRAFAAEVSDIVLARLGKPKAVDTSLCPIGGGVDYPKNIADFRAAVTSLARAGCRDEDLAAHWIERYGVHKAAAICEAGSSEVDGDTLIGSYSARELEWIVSKENVVHLDDLLMRRTQIAITGQAMEHLEVALALVGDTLGWSEQHRSKERDRISRMLRNHHASG